MIKKVTPSLAVLTIALLTAWTSSSVFADGSPRSNDFWWPNQLELSQLRQNASNADPMGDSFDYAEAFSQLDLDTLKAEIGELLTTSQDWWPADYGNYGPFFIRLAWHSAGTYRTLDGRGGSDGGQIRFEPLNSWPDNGNLDKARRLLWPIKQKYGRSISWGDLMVLTGTIAMDFMGFETYGFAGGREDDWQPELVYWGAEEEILASNKRYSAHGERKLEKPLGASQIGLIYVNPEGPNGNPDPLLAAKDIRETFGRMAMNDEETVALIAGGHTFGKAHGARSPKDCVGAEPAAGTIEQQGLGWKNNCGSGKGVDTITSGLEGAWTASPAQWTQQFLGNLFAFEWEQTRSPAGAIQWVPKDGVAANLVPDAHDPSKRHAPIMLTTDLSLRFDPSYSKISKRFLENPEEFEAAYAKAWFKLTHRDLGPRSRYLGSDLPAEAFIWQDPVPAVDHDLVSARDIVRLKNDILNSGLSVSELVRTAWSSAASYRDTDMRGGANGARVRLAPQKDWAVNNPQEIAKVITVLEDIQNEFNNSASGSTRISLADLIVLGGGAAIEQAAQAAGHDVDVPFNSGRTDASQAQTDVDSIAVLEPQADGFRNYISSDSLGEPAQLLVERADMLNLTAPEMTVLIGGMRALNANTGGSKHGVFTDRPGTLSNDFFVNLLDLSTQWKRSDSVEGVLVGHDQNGELRWTATEADLVFGSNSELRAIAEFYAFNNSQEQFVNDFINAWTKVMNLDRFDLNNTRSSRNQSFAGLN